MQQLLKIARIKTFFTVFQLKDFKGEKDIATVKFSSRTCDNINFFSPKMPLLFKSIAYPILVYASNTQNNLKN